jgi:transaldolase
VGRPDLQGKLAVANAKLAYQHYLRTLAGERWEYLAGKGARPQRCLWASTSTKNPAYRDVLYVEELIGPDTVNTMPLETVRAFQEHGEARDTLTDGLDEARRLFSDLAAAGVDVEDVTDTLETEGVQKFADSFAELLDGITAKLGSLTPA